MTSLIRLEQSDWMLRRNMYVITCHELMQNYELAQFNKLHEQRELRGGQK